MSLLNNFLLFLLGIFTIFIILFLLFLISNVISLFVGAPYIKSKKKAMDKMLEIAQIKKEDMIFDMGSGDGTLLIKAAKKYNLKRAFGIEINPILVLISKIRIFFSGTQNKIQIRQGNFLKQDLSQATVVFLYLLPGIQLKLEEKFKRELKSGARIISNTFPFPNLFLKRKVAYAISSKRKEYIKEYIIE